MKFLIYIDSYTKEIINKDVWTTGINDSYDICLQWHRYDVYGRIRRKSQLYIKDWT